VLLGIPPQNIDELLAGGPSRIPTAGTEVAVGIPAELLRRRPDVRRAEREVAAQSARIGIAETDLYPAFTLNGSIFVQASEFVNLFNRLAVGGAFAPSFSWNILNYGRIMNAVRAEEARFMQEVYQYQNVVLNANREAENALIGFLKSQERRDELLRATEAAIETRDLVNQQYTSGVVDFNRVFVAESSLAQQQDQLAQSEGAIALNLIDLYRALGGGWQARLYPGDMIDTLPSPSDANEPPHPPAETVAPPPVNTTNE
jgi:outer membrane protein TolC